MTDTTEDLAREAFEKIKAQDQPEVEAPPEESAEKIEWSEPEDFEKRLFWDNHTKESIEALRALPTESVQKMYDNVRKRQERVDALYREREKLERAVAEQRQTSATQAETQPSEPTLADLLGDEADLLDPRVVEALEKRFARPEPAPAPVQETPVVDEAALERILEPQRARLQGMYPGVRLDGAEWDAIARQADAEWNNPGYSEADPDAKLARVFDTVMFRTYGPGTPMQETTTPSVPVTRNTAAAPSVSKTPPADLSKEDREMLIFEHLKRNPGDADGARRIAGLQPHNVHPRLRR